MRLYFIRIIFNNLNIGNRYAVTKLILELN
jgi:hypothetical protein